MKDVATHTHGLRLSFRCGIFVCCCTHVDLGLAGGRQWNVYFCCDLARDSTRDVAVSGQQQLTVSPMPTHSHIHTHTRLMLIIHRSLIKRTSLCLDSVSTLCFIYSLLFSRRLADKPPQTMFQRRRSETIAFNKQYCSFSR